MVDDVANAARGRIYLGIEVSVLIYQASYHNA